MRAIIRLIIGIAVLGATLGGTMPASASPIYESYELAVPHGWVVEESWCNSHGICFQDMKPKLATYEDVAEWVLNDESDFGYQLEAGVINTGTPVTFTKCGAESSGAFSPPPGAEYSFVFLKGTIVVAVTYAPQRLFYDTSPALPNHAIQLEANGWFHRACERVPARSHDV